jgi:hypothetical protein
MRELGELLAQKELEFNNLSKQLENVAQELDAIRTTARLLEQSGAAKPSIQENPKRPSASVRSDNFSRETAVSELP